QMRTEKKPLDLNDNEKVIFTILKENQKIELSELKSKSNLSNKAWDKGIKGLTKNNLAKVSKGDKGLFVEIK
nr:lysine--tRNA ligase [Flavobacteriales bacterium]